MILSKRNVVDFSKRTSILYTLRKLIHYIKTKIPIKVKENKHPYLRRRSILRSQGSSNQFLQRERPFITPGSITIFDLTEPFISSQRRAILCIKEKGNPVFQSKRQYLTSQGKLYSDENTRQSLTHTEKHFRMKEIVILEIEERSNVLYEGRSHSFASKSRVNRRSKKKAIPDISERRDPARSNDERFLSIIEERSHPLLFEGKRFLSIIEEKWSAPLWRLAILFLDWREKRFAPPWR